MGNWTTYWIQAMVWWANGTWSWECLMKLKSHTSTHWMSAKFVCTQATGEALDSTLIIHMRLGPKNQACGDVQAVSHATAFELLPGKYGEEQLNFNRSLINNSGERLAPLSGNTYELGLATLNEVSLQEAMKLRCNLAVAFLGLISLTLIIKSASCKLANVWLTTSACWG